MKEKNKKTNQKEFVCPMCNRIAANVGYYHGFSVCSSCADTLKTPIRELTSIQMRLLSIFLSYWSGIKQRDEEIESRREIRVQKKMEAKLSQTIK